MKIPTGLNYKPVIVSENYENVDGRKAYNSDVKEISLGLVKCCDSRRPDISARVWHDGGEEGSGQWEELPIHRVLDLAILICRSSLHFQEAYRYPKLYDTDKATLDRIGLQGDAMSVSVCTDNPEIDEDIKQFDQALGSSGEMVGERFRVLSRLLSEMVY